MGATGLSVTGHRSFAPRPDAGQGQILVADTADDSAPMTGFEGRSRRLTGCDGVRAPRRGTASFRRGRRGSVRRLARPADSVGPSDPARRRLDPPPLFPWTRPATSGLRSPELRSPSALPDRRASRPSTKVPKPPAHPSLPPTPLPSPPTSVRSASGHRARSRAGSSVYGCSGARKTSSMAPSSTTWPST